MNAHQRRVHRRAVRIVLRATYEASSHPRALAHHPGYAIFAIRPGLPTRAIGPWARNKTAAWDGFWNSVDTHGFKWWLRIAITKVKRRSADTPVDHWRATFKR